MVSFQTRIDTVLADTKPLADQFSASNKQLYLVGGAVRDLALAQTENTVTLCDYDLTTDARPDEIRVIVEPLADRLWLAGQQFGTIGCIIEGRNFEITTHRQDAYDPDSRNPKVVFGDDLLTDLSRRDFTINAMAVRLTSGKQQGQLVDPFGGMNALAIGQLTTPMSAHTSFNDDPLRMLRAARFISQYHLTPTDDVIEAICSISPRLSIVSVERIQRELIKLLQMSDPTPGLQLMQDTGLAEYVFAGRHAISATSINRMPGLPNSLIPRISGLLFDYAEDHSLDQLASMLRQMRFSKRICHQVTSITRLVQALLSASSADNPAEAARRWTMQAAEETVRNSPSDKMELFSVVWNIAHVLAQEKGLSSQLEKLDDLRHHQPQLRLPVDGNDIMQALNIPSGRQVNEAVEYLSEQLAQHGQLDKETAINRLKNWHANQLN